VLNAYNNEIVIMCISNSIICTMCGIVNEDITLCSNKFIGMSMTRSESLLWTEHWCRGLSRPIATMRIVVCIECTFIYSIMRNDEFINTLPTRHQIRDVCTIMIKRGMTTMTIIEDEYGDLIKTDYPMTPVTMIRSRQTNMFNKMNVFPMHTRKRSKYTSVI